MQTRIFRENLKKSKGRNSEIKKVETIVFYATHRIDLNRIPIKFHEDIPNSYRDMGCTRLKFTQNKHKTIKGP